MRREGFTAAQIFGSSPRTWRVPARDEVDVQPLRDAAKQHGIDTLVLHAIYLINLASADDQIYEASVRSLIWTMTVAKWLGAVGVVTHMGSHLGSGFGSVRGRVDAALDRALSCSPLGPLLMLENTAGAGGNIGADFEEMRQVIEDLARPEPLRVCIDTAHAFAAGYDLRSPEGTDRLIDDLDRGPGRERLAMLHLNDSKCELGSRRDRHENIGFGHIGQEGFVNLMERAAIAGLPLILETPDPRRRPEDLRAVLDAYTAAAEKNAAGERMAVGASL